MSGEMLNNPFSTFDGLRIVVTPDQSWFSTMREHGCTEVQEGNYVDPNILVSHMLDKMGDREPVDSRGYRIRPCDLVGRLLTAIDDRRIFNRNLVVEFWPGFCEVGYVGDDRYSTFIYTPVWETHKELP